MCEDFVGNRQFDSWVMREDERHVRFGLGFGLNLQQKLAASCVWVCCKKQAFGGFGDERYERNWT